MLFENKHFGFGNACAWVLYEQSNAKQATQAIVDSRSGGI